MHKYSLLLLIHLIGISAFGQSKIGHLLTEDKINPLGVDQPQPRFSWQLFDPGRNVLQTAYEIKVTGNKKEVWSSGKVDSEQSAWVVYKGAPLESNKKYTWQVRAWDNKGQTTDWSEQASFQMAFLKASDWKARWIEVGFEEEESRPSPLFRKEFSTKKAIAAATAYITAHGLYEAQINGKRVGDAYLTPGWTSYNKRLQYQVYDVTEMLKTGKNAVGVTLGNGWYRGNLAWGGNKDIYGKTLGLLFQLMIEYTDGSKETVVSDGSWKCTTGPIRYSEIYHGETYDARLEKTGWLLPGYNDSDWAAAKVVDHPMDILIATYNEPVRKHETFKPVKVITTPLGETVLDFGQNLVGWVMVRAKGKAGDKIELSHTEVLDKGGNFYVESLRAAKQQDVYYLKGGGEESFEPHFTWQGFRYVRVDAYPGPVNPNDFTAVALYSDMKPAGSFSTSNEMINQLQHNIQWGQRGNFLDVPTDCPQRDERLGWTGDAQAFSRTATFNFDAHNFFAKWLKDVAADQNPDGRVPFVVPNVLGVNAGGSAGWADAATIIPWNMYLIYGDQKILADQYESMKAWVGFMEANSTDFLWNKGFHFGDWLFYRPEDDNDGTAAVTDKYLIAQCFFANSTQIVLNAARVLDKKEDVAKYAKLLDNVKSAFLKEYVTPSGRLVSSTQTAYVLALNFDMLPENLRASAAERLVANVKNYGNHLTTGFLGTPYLCHVLSRFGYPDVAYDLLLQDTYPSWLYPVKMGATTIWERWDGIKPDSTFQTPGMNSFNHYAYGAIGDWMYRVMAGIELDGDSGVGYKKVKIKPHLGGGFSHVEASLPTIYGELSSTWKIGGDRLVLNVNVPANTTATIYVPTEENREVLLDGMPVAGNKELSVQGREKGYLIVKTGSGNYRFESTVKPLITTADLEAYVGKYEVKDAAFRYFEVKIQQGKLVISAENFSSGIFDRDTMPDTFKSNEAKAEFFRDEHGKVVRMMVDARLLKFEGRRVENK